MITDPIANALCCIRNAIKAKQRTVSFYSSKILIAILEVMRREGYISDYLEKALDNGIKKVTVFLKYKSGVSIIRGIKRVSKPGYRVYCKADKLPIILNGMGTAIISTNKGIMDEKTSRRHNAGGEVIAYI